MVDPEQAVRAWEAEGVYRDLTVGDPPRRQRFFTVDRAAGRSQMLEPLVVIHGFPTSSFDFHLVIDELSRDRRVLLIDLLGYGFSDKPDLAYTIDVQADAVAAFVAELGVEELALLTHDLGDTVGGELLARQMEGRWPVRVSRRLVTNGSIYIDMARLSTGQELLLSLPDERLGPDAPINADGMTASLSATFSPEHAVDPGELTALWTLVARAEGHRNLPRLIRYIEERRRNERRFTGAIEGHPSPLSVVWGIDDPIAVSPMADELCRRRPDASLTRLEGVGHYPMIEAPVRFAAAVEPALG